MIIAKNFTDQDLSSLTPHLEILTLVLFLSYNFIICGFGVLLLVWFGKVSCLFSLFVSFKWLEIKNFNWFFIFK